MNKRTVITLILSLVFTALVLLAISSGFHHDNSAYHSVKQTHSSPATTVQPDKNTANISPPPAPASSTQASTPKSVATTVEPSSVQPATPSSDSTSHDKLYSVVDGNKLDANSYAGFKLFRNWCARCHGTYGQGLVGPNLAERLQVLTKEEFFNTVEHGKTGQIGNMPSWKNNMKVMQGRDKLYAYLKARADGAIGAVKPKKQ